MQYSTRKAVFATLFSSTALVAVPALAQDAQTTEDTGGYDQIVVTAQKREENLQSVPISIQAIGSEKLDDLNISDFRGYAAQLPSVAFQRAANSGGAPTTNVIYMRGVASGADGNHSGSLPSVGVYFDEQPVTTIGGNLDVHIYDIARIESLAGPQGTLYGASSEAGTIRIITNKPSTAGFEGRIDAEINTVRNGGIGGKLEGMINAPLSDNAALRVVGFYQHDAGFIDNVAGTRTFCGTTLYDMGGFANGCIRDGVSVNNAALVKKDYNDTEYWGGRAALKLDLDDSWTVTPAILYQESRSHGTYGSDPRVGDLQVQRFLPEYRDDRFIQAALTIEGKIGGWDITYAGAYLDWKASSSNDYTDYSEAYDSMYESVGGLAYYFAYLDSTGNTIDPRQRILGTDHFKKMSHELRLASPSTERLQLVAGLYFQRTTNDIHQDYQVAGLAPNLSVNGFPGTLWLTQQLRVDKDYAAFGELSYEVSDTIKLTAGARYFKFDNSLIGFFGFGRNPGNGFSDSPPNAAYSNRTGVAQCFTTAGTRLYDRDTDTYSSSLTLLPPAVAGSPCTNLAAYTGGGLQPVRKEGDGVTYRFNATWKPNSDALLYATFSRGYRPGGNNRRAGIASYDADYLQNYEAGWKLTLAPGVRFNGAVYMQDWKKFQFSFLGANSFTEIHNGPGARIYGVEMDFSYSNGPFYLSATGSFTDARTRQNLCSEDDPTFTCAGTDQSGRPILISAPKGARLPITPQWKLATTARYTAEAGPAKLYGQVNFTYQSSAASELRSAIYAVYPFTDVINPAALLGELKGYSTVNLAVGSEWDSFSIELFASNLFDERGQISRFQLCGSCGQRPYVVPINPRTIGLRAGAKF
jgi:iron complex outermembrane recepter protein